MANEADAKPPCLNLRCKEMFYKDISAPPTEHELAMAQAFGTFDNRAYWCQCTQTGRGPDDKPVNKGECSKAGRACWRGLEHLA